MDAKEGLIVCRIDCTMTSTAANESSNIQAALDRIRCKLGNGPATKSELRTTPARAASSGVREPAVAKFTPRSPEKRPGPTVSSMKELRQDIRLRLQQLHERTTPPLGGKQVHLPRPPAAKAAAVEEAADLIGTSVHSSLPEPAPVSIRAATAAGVPSSNERASLRAEWESARQEAEHQSQLRVQAESQATDLRRQLQAATRELEDAKTLAFQRQEESAARDRKRAAQDKGGQYVSCTDCAAAERLIT